MILFDLGGVLIENAWRDGLNALLPYELDRSQVLERWLASPAVKRFEHGLNVRAFSEIEPALRTEGLYR